MKKIIIIEGKQHIVETEEDVLTLNLKLTAMVTAYNELVPAEQQVKKFTDKKTAAHRLLEILPEAPPQPRMVPGSVKTILRELYAVQGASFTVNELLDKCGCTKKVLMDDLARLKNPLYCGKAGVLRIAKYADRYENMDDLGETTPDEYMAYNHNGTALMNAPSTKEAAEKEAAEYSAATGNHAYVDVYAADTAETEAPA